MLAQDQFDAIDFSDNELLKLENIPIFKRLTVIMACNNKIFKIDKDLAKSVPNLETLILTNNNICNLSDLDPLTGENTETAFTTELSIPWEI